MTRRQGGSVRGLVQRAFGLVLELRGHHEAPRLLSEAIAFLEMLAHHRDPHDPPLLVSVQVMRLRKS